MDFIRVYTGEDGASHFEPVTGELAEAWAKGFPSAHCAVRALAVGTLMDWHPAPQRQLVVHLSGQVEITLRDGASHVFGPGSARLMDDVTGSGHLTRVLGSEPSMQAVIRLA